MKMILGLLKYQRFLCLVTWDHGGVGLGLVLLRRLSRLYTTHKSRKREHVKRPPHHTAKGKDNAVIELRYMRIRADA